MQTFVKHLGYVSHKNGSVGKAAAHCKYLEYRRDEDGKRVQREIFGREKELSRSEFVEKLKEQPERGVIAHKLAISLDGKNQDTREIDLKALARNTMTAFEAKTGRNLDWIGVCHDKESNPHVHLVIAGRDRNGKEVYIKPSDLDILKKIADQERTRALELTRERGLMHERGQELSFERQLERERQFQPPEKTRELDRSRELGNFTLERSQDRGLEIGR